MKEKTSEEINNLLSEFDNPSINDEVTKLEMRDPSVKAQSELFDFFSTRLRGLSKRENFKDMIQLSLEAHIEAGEVSFSQLLSLYKIVYSESSLGAESVLALLRPTPGTPNPLLNAMDTRKAVNDSYDDMHNQLDSKSIQAIDLLYRALKKYETPQEKETE